MKQAIHEQVNDPNIEGMGKLLIPMTGMLFATKVKEILFGKERNVTYDSGCKLHKQAPETGLKGLKAVPLDIRLC